MPELVTPENVPDVDPALTPQLENYEAQIAALVLLARSGDITKREFELRLNDVVAAFVLMVFLLAGGSQSTPGARDELDRIEEIHKRSARLLTNDVFDGSYSVTDDQTLERADEKIGNRLALWLFGLAAVWSVGKAYIANQSRHLRWDLGMTEQHCTDCLRLNGQVHTAAAWNASGWRPQSRDLECNGYRCDCSLNETDEPEGGGF